VSFLLVSVTIKSTMLNGIMLSVVMLYGQGAHRFMHFKTKNIEFYLIPTSIFLCILWLKIVRYLTIQYGELSVVDNVGIVPSVWSHIISEYMVRKSNFLSFYLCFCLQWWLDSNPQPSTSIHLSMNYLVLNEAN
jgi:hypothetical protein